MSDTFEDTFLQVLERIRGVDTRISRTEVMETPIGGGREILSAARTYYVRTDGSDSNNGLTNVAAGAFLTIQHAYDVITSLLDLGGQAVSVQIGDGTYTGGLLITGPWTGGGTVTFQGNSVTPSNVVISTTSADCYRNNAVLPGVLTIKDQKLQTTTSGDCIFNTGTGTIQFTNIEFGTCATDQIAVNGAYGVITATGNYTVSGGAVTHWSAIAGTINVNAKTVTLTGTPNFSGFFAYADRLGLVSCFSDTFTGAATGIRYNASYNGIVFTNSANSETYLPGNALGVITKDGLYDFPARRVVRNTAQFDKTDTTLTNITGLSLTVLAGRTYRFRAYLRTTSNVASGVKAAIAGTATATTIAYDSYITQTGAIVAPGTSRGAALGATVANVTAVTVATITIEGYITVANAGTLTAQFADNAGVNTSSVLVSSTFEVEDVTS